VLAPGSASSWWRTIPGFPMRPRSASNSPQGRTALPALDQVTALFDEAGKKIISATSELALDYGRGVLKVTHLACRVVGTVGTGQP